MTNPLNLTIAGKEMSFRPGNALFGELAARGPSLPRVIKRDLTRYYQALRYWRMGLAQYTDRAHAWYALYVDDTGDLMGALAKRLLDPWQRICIVDALERAEQLVLRQSMSVDDALVAVGLVRAGETAKQLDSTANESAQES